MSGTEQPTPETRTPAQSASEAFWAAARLGAGLVELDRAECMDLLAAKTVGRIAYATESGARLLPVNYVLVRDSSAVRAGVRTQGHRTRSLIMVGEAASAEEALEHLVNQEGGPDQGLEDGEQVLTERVGSLPEVHQRTDQA